VAGRATGINGLGVERITRSGWKVLERETSRHCPTPQVVGMAIDFRSGVGHAKRRNAHAGGAVIARMIVLHSGRYLEHVRRLIGPEHGNEVRGNISSIVTGTERSSSTGGAENTATGAAEVVDARLVVGGWILRRQHERIAAAEVEGIGELVDTGD